MTEPQRRKYAFKPSQGLPDEFFGFDSDLEAGESEPAVIPILLSNAAVDLELAARVAAEPFWSDERGGGVGHASDNRRLSRQCLSHRRHGDPSGH